jgi:hypothetical protein
VTHKREIHFGKKTKGKMNESQAGTENKENVVGTFSTELLNQNHLYVTNVRHWSKIETFYDQILCDLIQIMSFQPENKTLSQELVEFSSLLQVKGGKENKQEKEDLKHFLIVETLHDLIQKEEKFAQEKKAWREKYIFFRLKQLQENFQKVQKQLSEVETHVQTLHQYHENIIREKFQKGFQEWKRDMFQVHNEFVTWKSRWTFHWQETLLRWEIQYKNFVQNLAAWTDEFITHQRALLVFSQDLVPLESFQLFENIARKTEKIKHYALERLGAQNTSLKDHASLIASTKKIRFFSYISFLLKLYQFWKSLEIRHRSVLQAELKGLAEKMKSKQDLVNKEQELVHQYQQSIDYLEEENQNLCEAILENNVREEVDLRTSISLKKSVESLKPQFLHHKNRLNQFLLDLERVQEKNRLAYSTLPDPVRLEELNEQEKQLIQQRQSIQEQSSTQLEKLTVQTKQDEDFRTQRFQYYVTRQLEASFKERRALEWFQWGLLEESLLSMNPSLLMLRNHITQYREDCLRLFSQTQFETLMNQLDSSWLVVKQYYFQTRTKLQLLHLEKLTQFASQALQELSATRLPTSS